VAILARYSSLTNDAINLCVNDNIPLGAWTLNDEDTIVNIDSYITTIISDSLNAGSILYNAHIICSNEQTTSLYTLYSGDFVRGGIAGNFPTKSYVSTINNRCCHTALDMPITGGKTVKAHVTGTSADTELHISIYSVSQEAVNVYGTGNVTIVTDLASATGAYAFAPAWKTSGSQWTIPDGCLYLWVAIRKADDSSITPDDIDRVIIEECVSATE
jgi:hypothetical protein